MNALRPNPARHESALVVSYAFDVNLFAGLGDNHLREVSNLLRIHADRSQLTELRARIDEILRDEMELERQVADRTVLENIHRVLPDEQMIDVPGSATPGDRSTSRLFDRFVGQVQALLGRIREQRRPRLQLDR